MGSGGWIVKKCSVLTDDEPTLETMTGYEEVIQDTILRDAYVSPTIHQPPFHAQKTQRIARYIILPSTSRSHSHNRYRLPSLDEFGKQAASRARIENLAARSGRREETVKELYSSDTTLAIREGA